MAINRVHHRGKSRIEVRKRWPDGTNFRRHYPNKRKAKQVLTQIEASIYDGTWPDLKRRLNGNKNGATPTIREFSKRFLDEYAKPRLRSWQRYELSLKTVSRRLGKTRLDQLQREAVYRWMKQRHRHVTKATVNRDVAALKRMCSWAFEIGVLKTHPLAGFRLFKEEIKERRPMSYEEYLSLIDQASDGLQRTFIVLMGETGCRRSEALHLKRQDLDFSNRTLAFNRVKNRKARLVPMSSRLQGVLRCWLSRPFSSRYVLENPHTGKRMKDPKRGFQSAANLAGIPWLRMHDMRRFRATQWALESVPVQTIQRLLGHADLQTTMRYLQPVDGAFEAVRRAFDRESARCLEVGEGDAGSPDQAILSGRHPGDIGQASVGASA